MLGITETRKNVQSSILLFDEEGFDFIIICTVEPL